MTFEALVRRDEYANRFVASTLGAAGFERPAAVHIAHCHNTAAKTADALTAAHERAVANSTSTLLHSLRVPFPGYEHDPDATPVLPDFAIVAPGGPNMSWLLMGDAKDYERVRSRIDDNRMLKGFLQVALGAEAVELWSLLPDGMRVSKFGVLAVPRNAFLQPQAQVEVLTDHRQEVATRIAQRQAELAGVEEQLEEVDSEYVKHLEATYDPVACASCSLFSFCRDNLRNSPDRRDLLVEIGVPRERREAIGVLLETPMEECAAPESLVTNVCATLTGVGVRTGERRVDQIGETGTVNLVLAKSDAATLGVYGISSRRIARKGASKWNTHSFADPQSAATRGLLMKLIGKQLQDAMLDMRLENPHAPSPVHIIVPDPATADLLVSIADNLAGVELSRLRWQHDVDEGRDPLTFDGELAVVPKKLSGAARLAVSFLLEADRGRALQLRSALVVARSSLARVVTAGGPVGNALRLDYLVDWAESTEDEPIEHRSHTDRIERREHTPGARLSSRESDSIHVAMVGDRHRVAPNPALYESLVERELAYKQRVLDRVIDVISAQPDSLAREAYRALEGDAQRVWRRRLELDSGTPVK